MLPALLAAGAALAVGCRDATSPQQQVAGAYTLRTVGGQPLPVVVSQSPAETVTLVSDALTLRSDGTLTEQGALQVVQSGSGATAAQSTSNTGTWTVSGSAVSAQLSGGTHLAGTFSGRNTITVAASTAAGANSAFVYQK